jgi:hypothetical protein
MVKHFIHIINFIDNVEIPKNSFVTGYVRNEWTSVDMSLIVENRNFIKLMPR